jgi:TonB family protein
MRFGCKFKQTSSYQSSGVIPGVAAGLHNTIAFSRGGVSVSSTVRSLSRFLLGFLSALLICVALSATGFLANGFAQDHAQRKIRSRVYPEYPEIARKMLLTGIVKLEVTVSPTGKVRDTKVIGGHPILVTAAVNAVEKWKFEPASAETTETVEFHFDPVK